MKTSIHFKNVKDNSELHNRREIDLDYVRKDLSYLNQFWTTDDIITRRKKIEEYCKAKSKRKLQKNSHAVREAVVVVKKDTTMEQLQFLALRLEQELRIRIFQIALHFDEGHYSLEKNKEWVPNYHAHLVADWQDLNTGKTLKHNSLDYIKMQDLAAECLEMERGEKSSKTHINSLKYKILKKEEELNELQKKIDEKQNLEKDYKTLEKKYEKLLALESKINPIWDDYVMKRSSFKDFFEYEQFLVYNNHKIGSYFWFDYLIYCNLNTSEIEDLLNFLGLEKDKINLLIDSTLLDKSKFSPELDEIRKELHLLAQNIDFSSLSKRINELRWRQRM